MEVDQVDQVAHKNKIKVNKKLTIPNKMLCLLHYLCIKLSSSIDGR